MWTWNRGGQSVVFAACVVALSACGNGGDEAAGGGAGSPEGPGTPTQSPTPADETDESRDSDEQVQPEGAESPEIDMPQEDAEVVDQMIRENSVGWEDYEVVSETELRFLATSGNQACYGQRYQTAESEDEVAVAIITGQREDGAEICTQEAVFIAIPVQLDEPLGERDVVELAEPELNQ